MTKSPQVSKSAKRTNPTLKYLANHWQLYVLLLIPVAFVFIFIASAIK